MKNIIHKKIILEFNFENLHLGFLVLKLNFVNGLFIYVANKLSSNIHVHTFE